MNGLLVAGTTSDAGKSLVTAGLCRALARRSIRVAPFKAQNMSNNSMVCVDSEGISAEIGRAQWIQAVAAGVTPEPAMNPILLKPTSDSGSAVVVMGQPSGFISSANWVAGRAELARKAHAAFDHLATRYDVVIAEGAGSPAEINLRSSDYVNMGLAQHGKLPVVVVGDIDRGGVFASLLGTVAFLNAADQRLVAGYIINKFRGDSTLLAPGISELQKVTGRRVFGVLPWARDMWLDSEDALNVSGRRSESTQARRVAVVRLPRISNFTDVDALGLEPDLDVYFASSPRDLADADLIVVPGTRSTIADLSWLKQRGLDAAIQRHAHAGRPVIGICGGAQILGSAISDPEAIEAAEATTVDGLELLDLTTRFQSQKALRLRHGHAFGQAVTGYEIHHGVITRGIAGEEFLDGQALGNVFGTMWHGAFESDGFRSEFLTRTLGLAPSGVSFDAARQARLDALGDLVEDHLDLDALLDLIGTGAPQNLPVLPPGGNR